MEVLLVRAGALGDLLLLRRAIAGLRLAGHGVRLLAPAAGAVLVGPGRGEVESCLPWDAPETAALLAGEARPGAVAEAVASADVVIAWTRSADVARALGRVARRLLPHDPVPPAAAGPGRNAIPTHAPARHASHWLAQPLHELGLEAPAELPLLSFTGAEHAEAGRLLAGTGLPPAFVALHPGSGSPAKNWPADRFLVLAGRLSAASADEPRFLLSLGPAEIERGFAAPPGALVAREWPLRVLGAAFSRASVYVGNDSGASHLAAAAGAPTLALFGPTDPAVWAPVGPRVLALRAPSGSLEALGVEEARRAAARLTSGASGPPCGR